MALAKACHLDMKPELLAGGFKQFKVGNTPFERADFMRVTKETQHFATTIAHSLDLSSFQPGYDAENQHMESPNS